jgi:hypothetical protein
MKIFLVSEISALHAKHLGTIHAQVSHTTTCLQGINNMLRLALLQSLQSTLSLPSLVPFCAFGESSPRLIPLSPLPTKHCLCSISLPKKLNKMRINQRHFLTFSLIKSTIRFVGIMTKDVHCVRD